MSINTRTIGYALPLALAVSLTGGSAEAAGDPTGAWLDDTGRGAIEIKDCGGKLCGHVIWVKDETDIKGCGRQIIGDAAPVSAGLWDGGWIYSPEKKRRYDVELKPLGDGTLRVKGYAGTKLFSKTMIWTKAPADLARCDAGQQAKADPVQPIAPAPAPVPSPAVKSAAVTDEPPAASSTGEATGGKAAAPSQAEKPVEAATPAPEASKPGDPGKPNTKTAEIENEPDGQAGIEGFVEKLGELQRETGYGLKVTSPGNCRLKLPFATLTFNCRED